MAVELLVDDRWRGMHGIGRYAQEIVSRLSVPWRAAVGGGGRAAALDFLRRRAGGAVDLVYSPGYNAAARATRQLITVHDLIHLASPWPQRAKYLAYYELVAKPTIRRAGKVFTVSEAAADAIREWLADDRVEVINTGEGVSPAFNLAAPAAPFERPTIVCVGNLRRHKNLSTAVEALALVREVGAVMVVPAAEAPALQELVTAAGVEGQVEIRSGLSDEELAELYRGAVATVFPTLMEGFGLPALESVQCGTPVLYWAGCRPVREIVQHRGIAVEAATDPREWADAIRQSASLPPIEPHAAEVYSWDRAAGVVECQLGG